MCGTQHTAGVLDIWHHHVKQSVFDRWADLLGSARDFATSERYRGDRSQRPQPGEVSARRRVFQPRDVKPVHLGQDLKHIVLRQPLVAVDVDRHIGADG